MLQRHLCSRARFCHPFSLLLFIILILNPFKAAVTFKMAAATKRKHVLVMTMPAFGHYIPGLELAKKIIEHHDVTFVLSIHKFKDIEERGILPPAPIQLHTFDDGFTYNVDEHIGDLTGFVKQLCVSKPYYENFINSLTITGDQKPGTSAIAPVDAIFCDATMPMPFQACHNRDILTYGFVPLSAKLFASYGAIDENTPSVPDEEFFSGTDESLNRGGKMAESFKSLALDFGSAQALVKEVLFNSFEELEPEAVVMLNSLPKFAKTPVAFIGPLLPEHKEKPEDEFTKKIRSWLDKQGERSVVYFSFGTVAVPSAEQLAEVAEALVSLKQPFIWSLRSYQQDMLPLKYIRSTVETMSDETPYLILHWTPQKRILAHKSTGVYVSHCGWNSTLEAVSYGVPVVAWPMLGDQHNNAALIEQWGIGRCVPVAGMKSQTTLAKDIADIIATVGGWKGSQAGENPFLRKAQELSDKAKNASSPDGKSTKNLLEVMNKIADM
ncbi:uncharacterized protein LOC129587539 [Paramacrobiotus metropolitanus]|uniref:uncharacterized protein LOC129587539 n=1 Tax=Paramacrobiotus metropolitanus TaxID=2943436 RepID=UPI0024463208|nr:uncharacterized protein LOC129587539 [Paramacrobiotus metropolitanus]